MNDLKILMEELLTEEEKLKLLKDQIWLPYGK